MFCVHEFPGLEIGGYPDVFGGEGALVLWAARSDRGSRSKAVTYLRSSLQIREGERRGRGRGQGGGDAGHEFMMERVRECVEAMEAMDT
eukprot:2066620-Rhodomonas_salina.1